MRKVLILAILVAFAWFSYTAISTGATFGKISVENYVYIQDKSKELDLRIDELTDKTTTQFDTKKATLDESIKSYKQVKEEFEELEEAQKEIAISSVDLFNIDFLWTIIGNYATEEEVLLQFDVVESVAKKSDTANYLMCDLQFNVTGDYTDVTKFIYDIEDDDRLKFEINDFKMKKHEVKILNSKNMTKEQIDAEKERQENYIEASFNIKGIPMNTTSISRIETPESEIGDAINEINAVITNQPK